MTSPQDAPSSNSIAANAIKALALCRSGAVNDGLALYKEILKSDYDLRKDLNVALHLRFLETMGLNDVAAEIRLDAIREGQNLCLKAGLGKSPLEIVEEYRELFARGIVNSAMVSDYLIELSKLGDTSELYRLFDVDRFVRCMDLPIADDDKFLKEVAASLLGKQTKENWHDAAQSIRAMHYIPDLDRHHDKRIQQLLSEISYQVELYVTDLRTNGADVLPWISQNYFIRAWALISSGEGYNVPHIHHKGWITGVFYIAGLDEIGSDGYPIGSLRIGAFDPAAGAARPPDLAVAPKPGRLVLFPSYFMHWTVPLGKPALRISIAFDVVDLRIAAKDR